MDVRSRNIVGTAAVFVVAAIAGSGAASAPPQAHELVGTWEWVTYADTPAGGPTVYAFGEHPLGLMIFTVEGRYAMTLMRNPPAPGVPTGDIDPDACMPEWYCSYFGSYEAASGSGRWVTSVEGGSIPSFIGTRQSRAYRIEGGRLVISETYTDAQGRHVTAVRVLRRVGAR